MIMDYLVDLLGDLKPTGKGDQYHGDCPFCDDKKGRLYIGVENQMAWCFNCSYSGSAVKLIVDFEGVTYKRAFEIYKDYNGVLYIPQDVKAELKQKLVFIDFKQYVTKSAIQLPDEYALLTGNSSVYANRVRKYLATRLVTKNQMETHKFGFCSTGKYEGRAILPIYREEELQFWVARATSKNAYKKEMSPSDEDFQISKSEVIFNIDRASKMYNTAILSEGIFDAVSWGDVGCGLLGKRASNTQIEVLLSYKEFLTDGVYLALDEDAWKETIELADNLYQYMPVRIIKVPDDPNAYAQKYGKPQCRKLMSTAVEYDKMYKIRSKLMK